MSASTQWAWVTYHRNGGVIVEQDGLKERRASFMRNRPATASASLAAEHPKCQRERGGLRPGVHEMRILRDGVPLDAVFALTDAEPTGDTDQQDIPFGWRGIECYLQDATVYGQASPFAGTTLPWSWIDAFQQREGGDFGITQGPVSGVPVVRYKTIRQDAELAASIIDLAESGDGFDWWIDAQRRYREAHPSRGGATDITLEWGVNLISYEHGEHAGPGELVSDVRVYGPESGPAPRTASHPETRATYGRREAALSYMSDFEDVEVTESQLQAYADAAIDDFTEPLTTLRLEVDLDHPKLKWGDWWLGSVVRVKLQIGLWADINADYVIDQIDLEWDEEGGVRAWWVVTLA